MSEQSHRAWLLKIAAAVPEDVADMFRAQGWDAASDQCEACAPEEMAAAIRDGNPYRRGDA